MGWYSRRRVEPSGKGTPFRWSSTTLTLELRNQPYLYSPLYIGSIWKVPRKYLKVFTFPVLLGNTTIFVCKHPIWLPLKIGRIHDVLHASLTSDILAWDLCIFSLLMAWRPSLGHIRRLVSFRCSRQCFCSATSTQRHRRGSNNIIIATADTTDKDNLCL